MNNKTDRVKSGGQDGLYLRTRGVHSMEKKRRGLFLMMDLLLLICIVAAIFFLILAFTPLQLGDRAEEREIVYTLELSGVDKSFVSLLKEGDTVKDAATGSVIGTVTEVRIRPYEAYISLPTPEIDAELGKHVVRKETNEEWNTVTLTVRVNADYEEGVGYEAEECRIAVGARYELLFPSFAGDGVCLSLVQIARQEVQP
ncbi:MAG: DUF4330 family protein [Ruminococcaceae bacterium]|nr:DUF4330 family protein [Oscillospiraceae bacterium]